ncbi:MAG: hypothetical protein LBF22_12075, partial [Deltaproteobacteria bacterium]|nr:hypothetical protein [Deltaproteobacteria bacterium]
DESQACKDESLFVTDEKREKIFLKKILESYGAIKLEDSFFHGKKGKSNVFVGDKTLLDDFFPKLLKKCKTIGVNKVDVLAFAFEIGNYLKIFEIFKEHGINLALKYIPMDIFEKNQNIEDFDFRELGKITLKAKKRNNSVEVELSNYKCFYSQGEDSVKNLKNKSSLIKIHNGEVVKISRDKTGELDFEPLTKKWQDWVDFWAVDFNFGQNSLLDSRQDNSEKKHESIKPQANVFKYHWQSYRSRQDRSLELKSMFYTYQKPGRKTIAVKLIDILGNDSLALIEVDI